MNERERNKTNLIKKIKHGLTIKLSI